MLCRISVLIVLISICSGRALCAELVTFDSAPDLTVGNNARLVAGSVDLTAGTVSPELINSSTQVMDFLFAQGVPTVFNVVSTTDGTLSSELLARGIPAYGALARVDLVRFEGDSNTFCKLFASLPSVAFVWVAGKGGHAIDSAAEAACVAPNILRVAALRLDQTDLIAESNFGSTVRVAAIGEGVKAAGLTGAVTDLDPSSAAAARVAARLVDQAACGCYRSGEELINAFLTSGTVVIESLRGKVADGRAVID